MDFIFRTYFIVDIQIFLNVSFVEYFFSFKNNSYPTSFYRFLKPNLSVFLLISFIRASPAIIAALLPKNCLCTGVLRGIMEELPTPETAEKRVIHPIPRVK